MWYFRLIVEYFKGLLKRRERPIIIIRELFLGVLAEIRKLYLKLSYGLDAWECMVPSLANDWNYYAHIHRYMFLREFINKFFNKPTLLDFGCGVAYGDKMISGSCSRIVGIDISKGAIKYAEKKSKAPNIRFYSFDLTQDVSLLDLGTFDVVISFDVIEHIESSKTDKFLANFSSLLKDGGLGIIGTPNKDVNENSSGDCSNPVHCNEMGAADFKNLLQKFFVVKDFSAQVWKKGHEFGRGIRNKKVNDVLNIIPEAEFAPGINNFGLLAVVAKKGGAK